MALLTDKSCSSDVADVVIARKLTAAPSEGQYVKSSKPIDPLLLRYFCMSSMVTYPKAFRSCIGVISLQDS